MRKITADIIYPISSALINNGVIVLNNDGKIIDVLNSQHEIESSELEKYSGVICPGFVNTHCHLELSYMKGKIQEKTGLDNFIKEVESIKKSGAEEIENAMILAEGEMIKNGIVAVGDISNTDVSFSLKNKSKLKYHTFIEIYGFHPSRAQAAIEKGKELYKKYSFIKGKNTCSITAHAPYSASEELLKKIEEFATENNADVFSVHNQESAEEQLMFAEGRGKILERLKNFGIDLSFWNFPGTSSLEWLINKIPGESILQLVHNTFTTHKDIEIAENRNKNIYWCFCPKANQYIENTLPNILQFKDKNVTIGTDSLASNDSLSILEELKVIQQNFPAISLEQLLKWSTFNGAKFLGFLEDLGSIEKGKTPGLNLIENIDLENSRLKNKSSVKVLA